MERRIIEVRSLQIYYHNNLIHVSSIITATLFVSGTARIFYQNACLLSSQSFLSTCSHESSSLKADSHIACSTHTATMPFPCHAVPLRLYNVSFPFDLHSAAVSDSHLPCRAHACSDHAVLLKATAQDGSRETAFGQPARIRLLPTTTWSTTKVVIRSI